MTDGATVLTIRMTSAQRDVVRHAAAVAGEADSAWARKTLLTVAGGTRADGSLSPEQRSVFRAWTCGPDDGAAQVQQAANACAYFLELIRETPTGEIVVRPRHGDAGQVPGHLVSSTWFRETTIYERPSERRFVIDGSPWLFALQDARFDRYSGGMELVLKAQRPY